MTLLRPGSVPSEGSLLPSYEAAGIAVRETAPMGAHDVLLANTLLSHDLVVKAAGRIPTVWWIHEPKAGVDLRIAKGRIDLKAFALADEVVFPTEWQARTLYRLYLGDRPYHVVPYGIGGDRAPKPRPFSLPAGAISLLQLGLLSRRKGHDLTLAALEAAADPRLHVFIAGSAADQPQFSDWFSGRIAASPLLRDRVHVLGSIDAATVDAYQQHVDALIFPTRDDLISVSMLEAMVHGTCVVSSDFGPIPETVVHERTGLLFPVGDAAAFAACLRRVADDPALRQRLGAAGRAIYQAKHGFDAHRAGMERILLAAAARRTETGGRRDGT